MAAAEARAVWQRAANRYFVQEDAKRAPKLACCQSSSSASKPVEAEPTSEADKVDHPVPGFMPLSKTPKYPDLPHPSTRWWLQQQPPHGYQKGWTREQLNIVEAEIAALGAGTGNSTSKVEELETSGIGGSCEELEMDLLGCSVSKIDSELGFDPESPWTGSEKNDPWWRVTDRNELASLVAQKSLDHIENCDLPPPRKVHVRTNPYAGMQGFKHDEILASSSESKIQTSGVSNKIFGEQGPHDSRKAHGEQWTSVEKHIQYEPEKSFRHVLRSSDVRNSGVPTQNDITETRLPEIDPSKAQLLEALRHSQTRAREAEEAAQQAYAEKEHIIKLFFRQASQLFAYKQWLQMLQLETLYLQIKNKDQPVSSLFPVALPWMPPKGKKMRKNWHKGAKGKRGKQNRTKHDIGKYAVALALGLGLVGAGLLLGWTVGWMLPSF